MSADGEINVAVRAEGVDEATGELGGGPAGGPDVATPGGDGGGGGGGRTGSFKKLLTRIATLLVFLGPILDVLGAVSGVLTAFVAPLAITLLRLLSPFLRLMLKALPTWLNFMAAVNKWVEKLASGELFLLIPALLTVALFKAIGQIQNWLSNLGDRATEKLDSLEQSFKQRLQQMLTDLRNIPGDIVSGLSGLFPDFGFGGDGGGAAGGLGGGFVDLLRDLVDRSGGGSDGGGAPVAISGGLAPFVESVTRDNNIDLA